MITAHLGKEDDQTLVTTAEDAVEFSKSLEKQCQKRFDISLHDFMNCSN